MIYRLISNCEACNEIRKLEKHHIKTRGSGGSDDELNLVSLCRSCHTSIHMFGSVKMIRIYPRLAAKFESMGWKLETIFGVTKLRRSV
jgi:hypothetical protein